MARHTCININISLSFLELFWKKISQKAMISKTAELCRYNKFVWYNEYYYAHNNTLQNRKSGFYAHHPVCRTTWCWQCLSKIVLNYLFTVSVPLSVWNLLVLDWIVEVEEKQGEISIIFSAILDWPISLPCVRQVELYSLAGQDCVMKFLLKFDLNATTMLRRCSFYSYPVV
mgnify:CR=1 FL=1